MSTPPLEPAERRRQIIEECARVCDAQAREPECPERAEYCAAAIRALCQTAEPSQPMPSGHVQVVGIPAADDVRTALVDAYALPPLNRYGDQIKIQRVRQIEGPDLWAVRYQSEVLSRAGKWEWEPMPSNRDDAFFARCRFDSADEAIKAGEAARRALEGKIDAAP